MEQRYKHQNSHNVDSSGDLPIISCLLSFASDLISAGISSSRKINLNQENVKLSKPQIISEQNSELNKKNTPKKHTHMTYQTLNINYIYEHGRLIDIVIVVATKMTSFPAQVIHTSLLIIKKITL